MEAAQCWQAWGQTVQAQVWSPPLGGHRDTHSGRSTGAGDCTVSICVSSCRTVERGGGYGGRLSGPPSCRAAAGAGWGHRAAGPRGGPGLYPSNWALCRLGGGAGGTSGAGAGPGTRVKGLVRGWGQATASAGASAATSPPSAANPAWVCPRPAHAPQQMTPPGGRWVPRSHLGLCGRCWAWRDAENGGSSTSGRRSPAGEEGALRGGASPCPRPMPPHLGRPSVAPQVSPWLLMACPPSPSAVPSQTAGPCGSTRTS